jgi:protocatechuate 3,4-dioxygenase beta subunit
MMMRSPSKPLVHLPHSLSEITGPTIGAERLVENDHDLTAQHEGEPLGERIIIHGRVLDEDGLPVPVKFGSSGASCRSRAWL